MKEKIIGLALLAVAGGYVVTGCTSTGQPAPNIGHRIAVGTACALQLAALGLEASRAEDADAVVDLLANKVAEGDDVAPILAVCSEAFANIGMDLAGATARSAARKMNDEVPR